jgi:TPR repeat protein
MTGDSDDQYYIGMAYRLSGNDYDARSWLQKSANQGNFKAKKELAGTYYNDGTTAIRTIATTLGNKVSVFDAQGRMVRSNVSPSEAVKGMTSGMYILKGEGKSIKVLVK